MTIFLFPKLKFIPRMRFKDMESIERITICSDSLKGENLTVSKHRWLCIYGLLNQKYVLCHRYCTLSIDIANNRLKIKENEKKEAGSWTMIES